DILAQIGFVVLVGLAAKNAILIVEFARQKEDEGATAGEAAVHAARTRLRPILMTSFAFILGVAPLAVATGAGAEMRRSLGTAVLFGMLGVTGFGLLFTPAFYTFVRNFGRHRRELSLSQAAVKATFLVLAFSLFAGGCGVGPRYVKPTTNLAPFHNLAVASATKPEFSAPPLDTWWTGFDDPMLVTVVQRALDQNLDLAAAFARVSQARAAAAAAGAQLLPTVDLEATGTAGHVRRRAFEAGDHSWNSGNHWCRRTPERPSPPARHHCSRAPACRVERANRRCDFGLLPEGFAFRRPWFRQHQRGHSLQWKGVPVHWDWSAAVAPVRFWKGRS